MRWRTRSNGNIMETVQPKFRIWNERPECEKTKHDGPFRKHSGPLMGHNDVTLQGYVIHRGSEVTDFNCDYNRQSTINHRPANIKDTRIFASIKIIIIFVSTLSICFSLLLYSLPRYCMWNCCVFPTFWTWMCLGFILGIADRVW